MRYACIAAAIVLLAAGCGYSGDGEVQGEMDFAIENRLSQARYVDWSTMGSGLVSCSVGVDQPCNFHEPGCRYECSQDNLQQSCCIFCERPYPSVKTIGAGETLLVHWSGKLYPLDETHCSECECYWVEDADPGSYRAEVCVYDDYLCEMEPCSEPDAEGVITGAAPTGTQTCHGVDFPVAYTQASLILPIE